VAVIAARDEADRIGSTVEAVRSITGVAEVVVASDGSIDGTPAEARRAGARVLACARPMGKGGAVETALSRTEPADAYLLLDGDLGASAKEAARLLDEVLSGRADLAIGALPRDPRHGGFRIVKRLAAGAVRVLAGFGAREPLSGQRALTGEAMRAVRPLAAGFGMEVAMTVDAVRAGLRVREVPVAMEHRPTGRDVAGFLHRGRQGAAVLRVAASRALGRR
jgi:glycosyltransferase involved in cell wall biosynthesis